MHNISLPKRCLHVSSKRQKLRFETFLSLGVIHFRKAFWWKHSQECDTVRVSISKYRRQKISTLFHYNCGCVFFVKGLKKKWERKGKKNPKRKEERKQIRTIKKKCNVRLRRHHFLSLLMLLLIMQGIFYRWARCMHVHTSHPELLAITQKKSFD